MKNKNVIPNLIIQLLWIAVALLIGYWLASAIFDTLLWRCVFSGLFSGLFSVIVYFLTTWISAMVKAFKDPDVLIASELRMSVKRYRHYQRLYDEYQLYMAKHGINSLASVEKFKEIFSQIDNPNEWRRYSAYREEQARIKMFENIIDREIND